MTTTDRRAHGERVLAALRDYLTKQRRGIVTTGDKIQKRPRRFGKARRGGGR